MWRDALQLTRNCFTAALETLFNEKLLFYIIWLKGYFYVSKMDSQRKYKSENNAKKQIKIDENSGTYREWIPTIILVKSEIFN